MILVDANVLIGYLKNPDAKILALPQTYLADPRTIQLDGTTTFLVSEIEA